MTYSFIQKLWDLCGFARARFSLYNEHLMCPHSLDQVLPEGPDGQTLPRLLQTHLLHVRFWQLRILALKGALVIVVQQMLADCTNFCGLHGGSGTVLVIKENLEVADKQFLKSFNPFTAMGEYSWHFFLHTCVGTEGEFSRHNQNVLIQGFIFFFEASQYIQN